MSKDENKKLVEQNISVMYLVMLGKMRHLKTNYEKIKGIFEKVFMIEQ